MRAELAAIKARIEALGIACWIGDAPTDSNGALPPTPYATLVAPTNTLDRDKPIAGVSDRVAADVQVKVTDLTLSNVVGRLKQVMDDLSPRQAPSRLDVDGRYATVQYDGTEAVFQDRDLVLPQAGRYYWCGVDAYRVESQPLP